MCECVRVSECVCGVRECVCECVCICVYVCEWEWEREETFPQSVHLNRKAKFPLKIAHF